ncbi:NYN domain-containing protein [Thermopetrobacter sp. TC1]|uniref:NYN domain-containing protein n=1 Tax=Thermopetrobacter sp. TC1 TaxID=1495045 RepID=UPI0009DD9107|nr:NYN domain-containing protein [Thermopetrobacter sp. TC1]
MERVITYIDGFNLYYGLREKNWKRFYWLNPVSLSEKLLKSNQVLVVCRYFTARIKSSDHGHQDANKQKVYLDALKTLDNLDCIYGKYMINYRNCFKCGCKWAEPKEKKTDVNIATQILIDAFNDKFDTAIIVSGDSDLSPPIKAIRNYFPEKRIIVAFPPKRVSVELKQVANAYLYIGKDKLKNSQLPQQIKLSNGHILKKPESWI